MSNLARKLERARRNVGRQKRLNNRQLQEWSLNPNHEMTVGCDLKRDGVALTVEALGKMLSNGVTNIKLVQDSTGQPWPDDLRDLFLDEAARWLEAKRGGGKYVPSGRALGVAPVGATGTPEVKLRV